MIIKSHKMASTSLATLLKLISVLSVLVQLSLALSADSQLSVEDHGQDDKVCNVHCLMLIFRSFASVELEILN